MWIYKVLSWIANLFKKEVEAPEVFEEEETETLEDQVQMVRMPDGLDMDEAKKYIASYSLDAWLNFQDNKPGYKDLESQIAVTNYAVNEAVELAPALWRVCNQIAQLNGYHTPPNWALVIARTAVIEYLTGNLRLLNEQTLKEMNEQ